MSHENDPRTPLSSARLCTDLPGEFNDHPSFSVIVPCHNEERAILQTIAQLRDTLKNCGPYELIIVNDGSTDRTGEILEQAVLDDPTLCVLTHPENRGYGASLKTGVVHASAETIVITDADGTYPNHEIPRMLELAEENDMVVGARNGGNVVYPLIRKIPKVFLRAYASWIAGRSIPDINSGLRVFPRAAAERFINLLPNGFSFTTTITLAMLTNNYRVHYHSIDYAARVGTSKIKPISDTLKFVRLIACTGMYFAPLRVIFPLAVAMGVCFAASACYDVLFLRNLTEKTLILFMMSTNGILFSLLSDMIVKKTSEGVKLEQRHMPQHVPAVRIAGRLHNRRNSDAAWAAPRSKAG